MAAIPVIAIFDIGKTNKKVFLFNEDYKVVYERTARFAEVADEDGYPCEDLQTLTDWFFASLQEITSLDKFSIKAINFSTYGASFVYIDESGRALTPLYNYLKPYPEQLKTKFYADYGGEVTLSGETASPVLGSLNSGMQLYRLKYERPDVFKKIKYALHLPQYLSFLVTGEAYTDLTSIGCHTGLWNFKANDYHHWVKNEGLVVKFAAVAPAHITANVNYHGHNIKAGSGLHDSSAALIPYLVSFHEPFLLLSTGTWSISLNPFNHAPLTQDELLNDCLCYLQYKGKPVKASRFLAGLEHEEQTARIAKHFRSPHNEYKHVRFDVDVLLNLQQNAPLIPAQHNGLKTSVFPQRDLSVFANYSEAYHQLMLDLVQRQYESTRLVLKGTAVKKIFVDGGFSKNSIFMHLLASAFPDMEIYAASMAQATAMGTALAIHKSWNRLPLPHNLITLQYFSATSEIKICA
ncbi:carbohydrate kinase [Mucilaginibacter hurinus]|uniref:Carbohydrate kinase n=2 Tax=Mucilaginibacter hurinus TaxID=2201324 RepID=A0A367GLI0_9SPHI|nr:carbohydrate kinase [Mucilaginibacter hurinus]